MRTRLGRRALELSEEAEIRLWTPDGRQALDYLMARGLTEATIRTARLGYTTAGWATDSGRARLGGHPLGGGPAIPRAIHLRAVGDVAHDERYRWLPGGTPCMYGVDTLAGHTTAVLAEGEMDALLLTQEAADLVPVVTVGSKTATLSEAVIRHLLPLLRVLVAYDIDDPSEQAAERSCARGTAAGFGGCGPPSPLARERTSGMPIGPVRDLRAWILDALDTLPFDWRPHRAQA